MYTHEFRPQIRTLPRLLIFCLCFFAGHYLLGQTPSFSASGLIGENINNPTSLQFGPDGRLYVSQQDGLVYAYTIERQGVDQYVITSTETIDLVQKHVPNHDDDGTPNGTKQRQVTSLLVVGTAQNPVLYVASSDWRISVGVDSDLDTNSGVITRLTWVGNGVNDPSGYWDKVDIVRGLPRSEENHATNGMQIDQNTNTLYVMQGGHTNKGAPSNNFAQTPEFALSAALLSVDLNAIEAMPINGAGFKKYIYDIPTLDDPTRGTPGQADPGDPFGGNDGRNQARIVIGGPVQVYSPGFRNAYDVVLTENGRLYTFDNGPNGTWGGTSPNCTNESSEANDTGYGDGLHFISGLGYYGGHPNYTRANPQNSGLFIYEKVGGIWTQTAAYNWITDFPDPPVPVSMANPIECDYLIPAVENQALAIVNASTNGITEYRASNFNNALKGNILAASFSGDIFSYEMNASGDAVVSQQSLFSGFGSQPLDVTAQGDGEIFAGTVWAATYGSNSITVFEPNDFITCTGTYSTELDDDFDNYSNADEIDNGSDPCSAGSKPSDRDLDYISDLNDPDDDNDGILDVVDAFAIDAENGLNTFLPIHYDLFNYDPGEGFFGLGFTGLMYNGASDYLNQFDESNLAAGGAAGLLTIEEVPEGDAFKTKNTQEYAFQFGMNIKMENGPFSIKVRMNGPFLGNNPGDSLSQGIYIGTGSQKDYLKFVVTAENGGGIEVSQETNDIAIGSVSVIPNILSATYIDLIIDIEPTSGVYITRYALAGGNEITLGGGLLNNSIAYAVQSESQALAVGLIATSAGPATPFSATWDRIDITGSGPTKTQIPDMEAAVGDAGDQVNLHDYFDDNAGDENLSYSIIENTSTEINAQIVTNNLGLTYPAVPDSGSITVRATDSDGYYVEQSFDIFLRTQRVVLYRINAGGGLKVALDDAIDWDADTAGSVSPLHDGNSNINGFDITFHDASIPSTTPLSIFNTERWDPAAAPEMNWEFPAEIPGIYEVRLYFANGFGGTSSPGQRVFNILLEGDTLLKSYDIAADVGHLTGVCKKLLVPVLDGNLNIEFLHLTENPLINGIEILGPASSETNLETSPNPLHFFSQQVFSTSAPQTLTLQNNGARAITITSAEITGTDSAMFNHSFGGVFTIQPGGSQNINITFSPTSEGLKSALLTINHDADNDPSEIILTGEAILGGQQVLFRVNAGGPQVAAADASDPDWSQDNASGISPYLSGITNIYGVTDNISLHQTVPSSAPISMFQIERWGPDPSQPMQWDFPVPEGTPVEVRLYFAETFLTTQSNANNPRIFDIEIDGTVPSAFDDLNIFEEVGHDVGIMKSFQTTSDGNIDIDFLHVSNNPAIKGLEIIDLSTPVENLRPELLATDDQTNDEQDLVSLQIVAQDPDGDTLTYSATDLPPGLGINSSTGLISGVVSDVAALGSPYETIFFVNDGYNSAVSDTIIWTINAPGLPTDICINTGGTEYINGAGTVFLADDYYSSNTGFFSTNQPIDNTTDDPLYQTERYGIDFNYSIPLEDGTYHVDLYFAEIYHGVNNGGGANSRVFSVDIEGVNALSNYDIFNTADIANGSPTGNGELYAVIETFQVTVSGGTLDIRFYKGVGGSDNAKIAAICAYPTAPNNPPVVQNPGDQENTVGDDVRLLIGASDDEGDLLTYSAIGLPPGLSIDSETGLISGAVEVGTESNSPYSVTASVSDGNNPPVTISFNWNILGNNVPVVNNPGNQVNTVGDAVSLAILATDDEGDILTYDATNLPPGLSIHPSSGLISGTISNGAEVNSPYVVIITVSDGVNGAVSTTFDWFINALNSPPVVTNPGIQVDMEGDDITLNIVANDVDGDDLVFDASGLPAGLAINEETGIISGTIANNASINSPYTVQVAVDDGFNGLVYVSFVWYVSNNLPPVVTTPNDQQNIEGDIVSLAVIATDSENDALNYQASNLPAGLTINPTTGVISGTVGAGTSNNSPYTVVITVSDGINPDVSVSFNWIIELPNQSPIVATPDDQTNEEGDGVSLAVTANDPDGDNLTYSANGLPAGLNINPTTGVISGTVGAGTSNNSPYTVVITVSDGINPDVSVSFNWIIELPNQSPIVATPDDQTNEEGDGVSLAVTANDPDGDNLTYSANGLPAGLNINPTTGVISGTVGAGTSNNSPYTVVITVSDGINPDVSVSFNWIIELPNQSPIVATPDDQTNEEGDGVSLAVTANDPDGDNLTYSANGLPAGLNINPTTGIISGTVGAGTSNNSPYTVVITVSDGINPDVSVSFNWIIELPNQSPIVATPDDQTNEEGDGVSLAVTANDPDGDNLTYSANGLPAGLNINPTTGVISGTVGAGTSNNSPYTVVITVSDGINPDVSVSFNWNINSPTIASAFMSINNGGGIGASTYGNNSFFITNTSNNDLKLSKLIIDISTSILPDLVFDPIGAAGDVVGKCFTANNGAADVGVLIPFDACTDPFSSPKDGGYEVMKIDFSNFDPSESFGFSVDIDPTSIQGATGSGVAGSISGLELSGATIWAIFENGDTIKSEAYYGGTAGSSNVCLETPISQAPGIGILNLPVPVIPRSSVVEDVDQTIRLSGPAGANVSLLAVEAGLFLSEVNGNGFDIDPFEGNQALNVREFNATIGSNGLVDIPITLNRTDHPEWETGLNYLMAVIKDSDNCTSYTSDVWVLKVEANEPPIISTISNQQNSEWESVQLTLYASDPDNDPLSFSAQNLPPGLSINDATGLISGAIAPGASVNSPYEVVINVSDGNHTVTQSFMWAIDVQPCIAPGIIGLVLVNSDLNIDVGTLMDGDTIRLQDLTYAFSVRAAACGFLADSVVMELSGDTIHKKTEGFAPYALFGDFSGDFQPWPATPGEYTITATPYTNYNGQVYGGTPYSIDVVVVDAPNLPPTVFNISTQFNYEWQYASLNIFAIDPDGDPLTYRADNLPPGLSINPNTGLINGNISPGASNGSPYWVTVGVNDGHNPEVTKSFYWVIGTQPCIGPTVKSFTLLNATANTEMYELADGDTIDLADFNHTLSVLAITCGSQPDEVVMALGGDTTHTRVEVNTPYTLFGGINGNHEPWPVTPGKYTISASPYLSINGLWGEGEALSINVVVINSTPVNNPPVLDPLANQYNLEGDVVAVQAFASDIDGDPLSFGATGLPFGLSMNPTTGWITGTVQAGTSVFSPYNVTISVSDGQEVVFQNFVWKIDRPVPGCEQPKVVDFYLVDADQDVDMYTLQDGAVIDLGQIANGINIRADLCGATPDSLVITVIEDTLHHQNEISAPYAVYGDLAGDYFAWDASAGKYLLTATPYIGGVPAGEAKSINFNVINGEVCIGDVLLVVGNVFLSEGDQAVKDRLEELGFSVMVMYADDARTEDAIGKSLVMISSTVFSVHVGSKFSDVGVPVMCWEAYLYDDLGLTGNQINTDFQFANFQTTIDVINPSHPMAAGLSGIIPVLDGLHTMPWGKPNLNAEVVATHPEQPTQAVLFGYETGVEMFGRFAPARRVGIFLHSNSPNYMNGDGWKLFDNALFWALDCENQDANLFPTVEITSPADGATYTSLETLTITANAQDPDGSLNSVSFYVNGDFIGIDPEFPYEISWSIPNYGVHTIEAIATGQEGETASATINIEAIESESCQGDVLMIVSNGPLGTGDLLVKQRLESMGFSVKTLNDNGAQAIHAIGKDLVIISSSVSSWEVGTKFKHVAVPVITYEAFLYDDMGMTGPVETVDYYWAFDQTYLVINDATHPMAAGYNAFVWTYTTPETFIWGNPSASAFKVASIIGQTNKYAIFGYEAGSPMVGLNAPARRVGLFTQFSGVPYMTTAAWDLFESAVYWAIGCGQNSPTGPTNPFSRKGAAEQMGENSTTLNTKIYPNPSVGNTTLYVEHEASGPIYVQISDMVGKVHYQTTITKESYSVETELPTQQLANGSYTIQIVHPAFSKTERLIKLNGK